MKTRCLRSFRNGAPRLRCSCYGSGQYIQVESGLAIASVCFFLASISEHNELHLNIYNTPLMLIESSHTLSRTSLPFQLMPCVPSCEGGRVNDIGAIKNSTLALHLDIAVMS